jgi:hypothetical protein
MPATSIMEFDFQVAYVINFQELLVTVKPHLL